MNLIRKAWSISISIAVLGALGAGVFFSFKYITARFRSLDEQETVLAVASVTVLLAAAIIGNAIRSLGQSKKAHHLHVQKAAVYRNLIGFWEGILREGLIPGDAAVIQLDEDLVSLRRLLILYGGHEVLKAHTALRRSVGEGKMKSIEPHWNALVMAMRKDLGSGTQKLTSEDLSDFFLVDPEEMNLEIRDDHRQRRHPNVPIIAKP